MIIDTRTIERDGFTVIVTKEADQDSSPEEADCYTKEDIDAFRIHQDWMYVGIVARAYRDDVELGMSALWGCEDGFLPGVERYVDAFEHTLGEDDNDYDVPGDAIADARVALAKLTKEAAS